MTPRERVQQQINTKSKEKRHSGKVSQMAIKTSKDRENDYSNESVFQCTRWLRPEDRKGPRNQKGGSKDQNKQRKETLKCKNYFQSTVIREYSSCLSPCSSGLSPGCVDGISLVTLAAGRRDNQILPIP